VTLYQNNTITARQNITKQNNDITIKHLARLQAITYMQNMRNEPNTNQSAYTIAFERYQSLVISSLSTAPLSRTVASNISLKPAHQMLYIHHLRDGLSLAVHRTGTDYQTTTVTTLKLQMQIN